MRPRICAEPCKPFPSAVDRVWLGSQAFQSASAFNVNIGAWNTARVTTLESVCAASGPAARHLRRTRAVGVQCGTAGCARQHRRCARAHVCTHTRIGSRWSRVTDKAMYIFKSEVPPL